MSYNNNNNSTTNNSTTYFEPPIIFLDEYYDNYYDLLDTNNATNVDVGSLDEVHATTLDVIGIHSNIHSNNNINNTSGSTNSTIKSATADATSIGKSAGTRSIPNTDSKNTQGGVMPIHSNNNKNTNNDKRRDECTSPMQRLTYYYLRTKNGIIIRHE
jgi:hypothetical protein